MIRARLGGAVAKAALPVLSILVCVGACAATSSAEPPGRQARASAPANAAPFAASPSSSAHVPVSAPATAPASGRLRVAVISDLNGSYGSTTYGPEVHGAVASVVGQVRPDVVLVTGDMVAGMRANLRYGAMWSGFHAAVSEPLAAAGIPLAPAPGNHDASGYPVYAAERGEYARQWSQPGRVPALRFVDREHYPLRYSFTLGPAFFIALDATTVGPVSVEQRAWVDRQLAATTLPVKIAYGHLPLHPIAHGRVAEVLNDRELEEVFTRRGLTAYVSGHHHAYYPGAAGGFLQIAMPCLGGGARPVVGTTGASPRALVVIDVEDGRVTAVDALQAPSFVTAIDRTRLPQRISHRQHLLVRDDVAGLLPRPDTNVARSGATAPTAHPASLAAPLR